MIYISDLKKSFKGQVAIDIEKLNISSGSNIGLVGNNGAGKTTLFRLLLDLLPADQGFCEINDEKIVGNDAWKTITAAYLDDRFLIPYLTPYEYWEFILKTRNITYSNIGEVVSPYARLLTDDLKSGKYIRELSAGNKARVGIISVFLGEPELIILDEPYANLDPSSQQSLVSMIDNKPKDTTIIVSSHDLNHIQKVSDEIILMENGKILKQLSRTNQNLEEINQYFTSEALTD
ncbi:MAG: ABC transporter ATP-binding protein [Fulvivirga sp.]